MSKKSTLCRRAFRQALKHGNRDIERNRDKIAGFGSILLVALIAHLLGCNLIEIAPALLSLTTFFVVMYGFRFFQSLWKNGGAALGKIILAVSLCVYLLLIFIVFNLAGEAACVPVVPPSQEPEKTGTPLPPTKTVIPSATETPTVPPTETPTETSSPTPTPNPLSLLGNCNIVDPPCAYDIEVDDYAIRVALKIYGEGHISSAGLIANLYRNSRGQIERFFANRSLIVPAVNQEASVEYMLFYMNEQLGFDYSICERGNPETYIFPCLYVSSGESYSLLAEIFYKAYPQYSSATRIENIQTANRIYYDAVTGELVFKDRPNVGDIVVLPLIP